MHTLDTTPIDTEEMSQQLHKRNLGGMPAPIRLFMVEQGITDYETLLAKLRSPEFKNQSGNLQFDATNIDRAIEIMGVSSPGERPANFGVCIDKNVLEDTIGALEEICADIRKKRMEGMQGQTQEQLQDMLCTPAPKDGASPITQSLPTTR